MEKSHLEISIKLLNKRVQSAEEDIKEALKYKTNYDFFMNSAVEHLRKVAKKAIKISKELGEEYKLKIKKNIINEVKVYVKYKKNY